MAERKHALVTGAGMGIGQGIALALARTGHAVAVHYAHSEKGAHETAAAIRAEGGEAVVIGGDLRDIPTCRRVVDQAAEALGGLDVLVNNGGVTRIADFTETTEAQFAEMFEINIRAYFFCAQQAVPHMVKRGGGAIINISSVHGGGGVPGFAAYAATKGAVVAFTRTVSQDLCTRKIRVNAVAPGVVEVPRYFDNPDYTTEIGNSWVPWGRVGTPADIGGAVAYLASDAAEWVTGQVLYVDGGTNARMGFNP